MDTLFWLSVTVVLYVYAGYPLLLAAWARAVDRRPRSRAFEPGRWPSISIIVAARNEAHRLPARVTNLLEQDYPGPRQIIVVSDGSTDEPRAALARWAGEIQLIELPPGGKPVALNGGVLAARGDVLVFADARQRFAPGALRALVANFADPQVGGVTGELVLDCENGAPTDSSVGEGVGLYWKYEKWLRRKESRVWSTLGATGAIYAMRRSVWQPLPAASLLDDVLAPMRAVLGGSRIVFEEQAIAFDRAAPDATAESIRKTRTLAGNYQILAHEPRLLLPIVNPVWLQYASHKIGRLLVPWALVALLASSALLATAAWFYTVVLAAQLAFYALAAAGAWLNVRERGSRIAFTFVMMNYSAVAGLAALRRGREVWR
ncbi:MAG: glycosyltransferase family 2 protein [Acidobacteria bacterium]|nr:MAG: glycosyltransferase family 2 protein [Acidobacteriota bacterium]